MQNKKLILIISIVVILVLLIPSAFYIYNFKSFNISKSANDWGTFGDFFGGVTNTIISLLSLIILAYISWIVSKFSSEENKKLYLLEKRIEAYDELLKYLPKLHLTPKSIVKRLNLINKWAQRDGIESLDKIEIKLEEISKDILFCHEYHYFLFNFNARYNHLFKYDFDSENYKGLIQTSKDFCDGMDEFHKQLSDGEGLTQDIQALFDLHVNFLVIFINDLKEEIE
jgi:uncharacterized membrane protein